MPVKHRGIAVPQFTDATIQQVFGADDAENEVKERFLEYFFSNSAYESLVSDLPVRVLVGHKGVGKSALLRRAFLEDQGKSALSFWLRPDDVVDVQERAKTFEDFIRRVEAWKYELAKFLATMVVERAYGASALAVVPELGKGRTRDLISVTTRALDEQGKGKNVTVYVDDIDRGWSASPQDIKNISALLTAVRDLSGSDRRIRFRIGLRSDVYFLVRTSDESTDKIEQNVIWLRWNNDQIIRLMAKRIETYFRSERTDAELQRLSQGEISRQILAKVIDPIYHGRGHWAEKPIHNVLLSLTRARPRDLVKLFHGAARIAFRDRNEIISSTNLEDSFETYSQERLQDIINEFRSELPDMRTLVMHMRPTRRERRTAESYLFSTDELSEKLQAIMHHATLRFTNGQRVTPRSLIQFLYKIDFVTARRDGSDGIDRKYFDESRFLANEVVEFGYHWEIHPAYRWALQPQDVQDVIDSLGR